MMEKIFIKILQPNQKVDEAYIIVNNSSSCELAFYAKDESVKKFVGVDLFETAMQFRKWLEGKNQFALCNFSRRNIQPSGMSRQMSYGRKAYLIRSKDASSLIDIFASCDVNEISTFSERQLFIEQWV